MTFQSAPPRDLPEGWKPEDMGMFQSAPPRGGRPRLLGIRIIKVEFQSAPPRGGRLRFRF